jgi:di/tricarboxylate transporter
LTAEEIEMKLAKRMAGLMARMLGRAPRRAVLSLLGALMVASLNWNGAAQQTASRASSGNLCSAPFLFARCPRLG